MALDVAAFGGSYRLPAERADAGLFHISSISNTSETWVTGRPQVRQQTQAPLGSRLLRRRRSRVASWIAAVRHWWQRSSGVSP